MNILIKLTCLIGLVIAPILGQDMAVANTPEVDEVTIIQEAVKVEPVAQFSTDRSEALTTAEKIAETISEIEALNEKQTTELAERKE